MMPGKDGEWECQLLYVETCIGSFSESWSFQVTAAAF